MLFILAWRNIWRNKRRSLIVVTSIVVGLAAIIFVESLSRGFMKQMFENELGAHTSHLQIHQRGFQSNKVIQNHIATDSLVVRAVASQSGIKHFSERVIAFGLLSSASNSAGVSIVGIDPPREAKVTTIEAFVLEGRYPSGAGNEILMSERLSEMLDVGLGDRIVAMASALDGKVGSEMFRVVGLYRSANSAFDRMYVYIPIQDAQTMLRIGRGIVEIAVIARDMDTVPTIKNELAAILGDTFEVLSYQDLLPTLLMQMEMAGQMMFIFYLIIGLAMIFGIINTMLMSVFERIQEFGVLKAIGMSDGRLFSMILLEAFLLGSLGGAVGLALGIGINLQLSMSGLNFAAFSEGLERYGTGAIVYPVLNYVSVLSGTLLILLICIVGAMYPAYRAVKLQPISAIRYV